MANTNLTFKPCIKCSATDRDKKGNCKACARARSATWRSANYERAMAATTAWLAENLENVKATRSVWLKANRVATRVYCQNRRARKRENGGNISKDLAAKLFKLQKGKCACCGKPLGDNYHLDHVMPLALGGQNIDNNMQLLRRQCNQQKAASHPVDFMRSRGFLI